MRSTPELDRQLRERFRQAVDKADGGNADGFGRRLGYTNGGYVREILCGVKPVREAIIERVHALDGFAHWFSHLLPPVVAADVIQRTGSDPFGPQPSLAAQEIARSFDAIPDQLVKKKLYALLLNEIRIASNASRQPAAAPTPTPVPTVRRAPGKSPA